MNIYQGGGTYQGKIIPIKRLASLIIGIISPLVGYDPLISVHMRFQSSNCYIYKTTYIIQTPILSNQYLKICIKLQAICQ